MANLVGYAGLQRRLTAIGGTQSTRAMMMQLGLLAVREQKLLVHRKTGTTGRTIRVSHADADSVTTEARAAAVFLERGTRAHLIRPRTKRALRFAATAAGRRLTGSPRKGAAVVFATRVNHPGTRAYPFMRPGARKAIEKAGLTDAIVTAWNRAD